jgi:uncharacterized protein (DUF433 family)
MSNLETEQAMPLAAWDDGSIRVTGSRVPLDTIVHEFKLGATAEQIMHSFPSLSLREVYGAIFYYLNNTQSVEEYLRRRHERAEDTRKFIESRLDTKALRDRILARHRETSAVK